MVIVKQRHTHPVGELSASVVALGQVEDGVVVSVATVEEGANVLHVVLVVNLYGLCWICHYWKQKKKKHIIESPDWKIRKIISFFFLFKKGFLVVLDNIELKYCFLVLSPDMSAQTEN